MAWLPNGEKISKISLFVLAQLTNVTDRRTLRYVTLRDSYVYNGLCVIVKLNVILGVLTIYAN